jgi:hypothetical protein
MARVSQVSRAYSARYTAAPTEMGMLTMAVAKVNTTVPTMAGRIPPSFMPLLGNSVKNSQLMAPMPWTTI